MGNQIPKEIQLTTHDYMLYLPSGADLNFKSTHFDQLMINSSSSQCTFVNISPHFSGSV